MTGYVNKDLAPLSLTLSLSLYIYIYIYVCACVCVFVCVCVCVSVYERESGWENVLDKCAHGFVRESGWVNVWGKCEREWVSDRSSRRHPVSEQSFWIQVITGRPTQVSPCEGISGSISILFPYLVHRIWMVCEMGCKWPYNFCLCGCCWQDLLKNNT